MKQIAIFLLSLVINTHLFAEEVNISISPIAENLIVFESEKDFFEAKQKFIDIVSQKPYLYKGESTYALKKVFKIEFCNPKVGQDTVKALKKYLEETKGFSKEEAGLVVRDIHTIYPCGIVSFRQYIDEEGFYITRAVLEDPVHLYITLIPMLKDIKIKGLDESLTEEFSQLVIQALTE